MATVQTAGLWLSLDSVYQAPRSPEYVDFLDQRIVGSTRSWPSFFASIHSLVAVRLDSDSACVGYIVSAQTCIS